MITKDTRILEMVGSEKERGVKMKMMMMMMMMMMMKMMMMKEVVAIHFSPSWVRK